MKHILLGTTALVAAGLVAGPVSAQEGVKLGLGGFYFGAAGGLIDESIDDAPFDEDRFDDVDFKQNVEVHFKGETTLDNGLTVGARVELEAQEQDDEIDEVWAYFSGGFGELRFGDDDDAYAHLCYLVPTASAAFGADSPFLNFSNAGSIGYGATNGTCYGMSGDSTKLIYFSPSFGGFQLAASYAPDDNENVAGNTTGTGLAEDGRLENIISAAATYAADVNGFALAIGGGASFGQREDFNGVSPAADDPVFYNGYAQVGFGGWTVGAATEFRTEVAEDLDNVVYGVGATYGFQAWTVGLGWTHGDYEFADGAEVDDTYDVIQFTAAYALGPGITLDAMAGWNKYDADAGPEYEGIEAALGFGLSF